MINYKNNWYKDYVDLLYDIIKNDEQEFSERIFPHSQYFYLRTHLQEKFPDQKWTMGKVKQIIDEELALKTITLKDEKGLLSASSYGSIDFRDLIDESLLKVISEVQDTL